MKSFALSATRSTETKISPFNSLHFEQVFRVARKANLVGENTEFEFLGFGTMNGPDGKPFKTRDGGVMSLSSLLNTVQTTAKSKLLENNPNATDEDALRIGVAALKFGDLMIPNNNAGNWE